jgi:hypothetical protein
MKRFKYSDSLGDVECILKAQLQRANKTGDSKVARTSDERPELKVQLGVKLNDAS